MKSYVGMDVHSKSSVFVIQNERREELGRGEVPTSVEGFPSLRLGFKLSRSKERSCMYRRPRLSTCEIPSRGAATSFVSGRRRSTRRRRCSGARGSARLSRQHLGTLRAWQRLLGALVPHPQVRSYVELHHRAWQTALEQKNACEKSLETQHAAFREDLERLETVPGVGEIVALTAIAVFSDVTRFPTAKHASSYTGLVPQTYQSGDTNRQGHITRTGSPELRAMLVQAAHTARRQNSPLNPFLRNLTLRLGARRAVTAVAHRLCRILYAMLRDKTSFDRSMLKAREPRTTSQAARIYQLKPQAAKSR